MSERRRHRILYLQYTNPAAYPPVEHSAWMMAEAGWDVLMLGVALEKTLTLRAHPRIRCELMAPSDRGWRQKLHYVRFAAWSLARAERFHPAWIYASDMLSSPAALLTCGWQSSDRARHRAVEAPFRRATSRVSTVGAGPCDSRRETHHTRLLPLGWPSPPAGGRAA